MYYNVVQVTQNNSTGFLSDDVVGSWLVKVTPSDVVTSVSYSTLFAQAQIKGDAIQPANGRCNVSFSQSQLPWPPQPNSNPPTIACGSERAALNIAPAIAPDGTIYTISRAHLASRYNYLVAVNSNMTGKWAASFRNRLNDGCGVSFAIGNPGGVGANGGCTAGATFGVDPGTNEPPPARVLDDSSSTPVIAPDGSIFYGAYTSYNWAQGHMMHFSANGDFLNAFNFGWDNTPAIYPHGGTYSVVITADRDSEIIVPIRTGARTVPTPTLHSWDRNSTSFRNSLPTSILSGASRTPIRTAARAILMARLRAYPTIPMALNGA